MPIGTLDIPVLGGNATALVDSLFISPPGTPRARAFLSPLMQVANAASAQAFLGGSALPFFNVPALAAALPATAAPNPATAPVQSFVSLLNPPEFQAMLDTWWQIWSGALGVFNPSDVAVLTVLRDYIADPGGVLPAGVPTPLSLWVPQLAYDGMLGEQLKLRVIGYNQLALGVGAPIVWNQANVLQFLQYLAVGAHFVAVHAPRDMAALPGPPALLPFYTVFGNALGATSTAARMNSHYSGAGGLTNVLAAYAYPSLVNAETAPVNCPYIAALLVGRTAWSLLGNEYNTFFQLEGWPATGYTGVGFNLFPPGLDTGRHGADFATHSATKWNISTYGASVFSEKRGTTIFLAPPAWAPAPNAATIMAPYVGAETPQRWLDTNLVRL